MEHAIFAFLIGCGFVGLGMKIGYGLGADHAHGRQQLIEQCEAELPRNVKCEIVMTAVPVESE